MVAEAVAVTEVVAGKAGLGALRQQDVAVAASLCHCGCVGTGGRWWAQVRGA